MIKAGYDFDAARTVLLPVPGDGGAHWVVGGSTGSGKTQFIHSVIAQLARLENTAIVISDPAFMDLEPIWGKRASCIALGRQGAGWLLEQLEREMQWRLRHGRSTGVDKLTPSPATPRIVALFDELAMVTLGGVKNAPNRLIDVAMVGRKVITGLVLGTNSPKATVLPRLVTEQCPVRVALRTEEPEQTDAILSTQRVKAHAIPFDNPGEMYVRMPSGGFAHSKAAYESLDFYKQIAADTAHLTPVLPADRGWMRLYDPYEQECESE